MKHADLLSAARLLVNVGLTDPEHATIDDDAKTLPDPQNHGTWVQAWVFVPDPEGKP